MLANALMPIGVQGQTSPNTNPGFETSVKLVNPHTGYRIPVSKTYCNSSVRCVGDVSRILQVLQTQQAQQLATLQQTVGPSVLDTSHSCRRWQAHRAKLDHAILTSTQTWKDQQQQGLTTQPLRVVLCQVNTGGSLASPSMGPGSEEAGAAAQQDPYCGGEDSEEPTKAPVHS